jgi:hypothetical protein
MTLEDLTKIIPAAAALIAVHSRAVSAMENCRTTGADNISLKLQNWIDELRKDCASFLQLSAKLEELACPNPHSSFEDQKRTFRTFDERVDARAKAHELLIRIRLRLNPNEADHLWSCSVALLRYAKTRRPAETDDDRIKSAMAFHEQTNRVVRHLQTILKKE